MTHHFTAGALRAWDRAARIAAHAAADEVSPEHLWIAVWSEETRAGEILAAFGVAADVEGLPESSELGRAGDPPAGHSPALNEALHQVRAAAERFVSESGGSTEVGTEHLLFGLFVVESPVRDWLLKQGIDKEALTIAVHGAAGVVTDSIPVDFTWNAKPLGRTDETDTYRLLDAAANRAREGLRVVEDFVRFVLDDRHLTELLKSWRHDFRAAMDALDPSRLLAARETTADVGTTVRTAAEFRRGSTAEVVVASFKRMQEALRSLEEFGKTLSGNLKLGEHCEQLRYRLYTLEKAVGVTWASRRRLENRLLYLLLTESLCRRPLDAVLRAASDNGVSVIQIREKAWPDRQILEHARRLREWTRERGLLLIVNDRPDLAVLCDADGVHVGQEELSVREVRQIVGPARLVGVSTHTIAQARQAVVDGADYLGVGPVFPSGTKNFHKLAGLDFVREVAAEITRPWYAIGGIHAGNLDDVLAAGATRIAVSGAICGADDPVSATLELRSRL